MYLFMYSSTFLCWFDSYVFDGCLKRLKIARTVLFVFFPTLNWFCLTQNLYFQSYNTCCYWLECYFVSKSVGITKDIEGKVIFSSSRRMLFAKVSNEFWPNLSNNRYESLCISSKTLYVSSMTVFTVIFMLFINFWLYTHFLFLWLLIYFWSYFNCS